MIKALLQVLTAALLLATASLASAQNEPMDLRIAVEGAFPPFSYTTADGEVGGFDIEIANALCEAMNADCTLVTQDWDGMIPGLLARKYDAIIASMSITEERKKRVDFTNKYYQTPARFIAPKGTEAEFTAEGLANKVIGVQRATIFDRYISENFPDAEIKRYTSQDDVYLDLQNGRLDLSFVDSLAALGGFLETEAGQDFEFVGPTVTDPKWVGEGIGIAIRKGREDLKEKFNAAIAEIRANGTYDEIRQDYFDFDIYGD